LPGGDVKQKFSGVSPGAGETFGASVRSYGLDLGEHQFASQSAANHERETIGQLGEINDKA
jgi:hypothetical protein